MIFHRFACRAHSLAMINIIKANERGHANHGWLDTYHSFSFADYYNPDRMGYRSLRVINDDLVMPGEGFGAHPHRDMEIITYILSGQLEHKDSMGNGRVIKTGDVQYMAAGKGVQHSEFNPSKEEAVHLLQIWIQPDEKGVKPRYAEKSFSNAETGKLHLVTSKADAMVRLRSIRMRICCWPSSMPDRTSRMRWARIAMPGCMLRKAKSA